MQIPPYEKRSFPINDETYDKMLKNMPANHQFMTNSRSQDSSDHEEEVTYLDDDRVASSDSESTESAIGEGEDPNDPEWSDTDRSNRERYKR